MEGKPKADLTSPSAFGKGLMESHYENDLESQAVNARRKHQELVQPSSFYS